MDIKGNVRIPVRPVNTEGSVDLDFFVVNTNSCVLLVKKFYEVV